MRMHMIVWSLIACLFAPCVQLDAQPLRPETMYAESHALIIAVSRYTDWPSLPEAEKDRPEVTYTLEKLRFHLEVALPPRTQNELKGASKGFIDKWDRDPNTHRDNHLLFYFAGTIFSMNHDIPKEISYMMAEPVRQLINSGSSDEKVKDNLSYFRQRFAASLLARKPDPDADGFVTGGELGYFLSKKVVADTHGYQYPQFGKIAHPNYGKGDFVFMPPKLSTPTLDLAVATSRIVELPDLTVLKRWQQFLAYTTQDNPYYEENERLRQMVQDRIAGLKVDPPPGPSREGEKVWTDPVTGMEFVWVPGGSFQMGCVSGSGECDSDETPVHTVELDGFWMGKYEVTNAQYRKWKRDHDSREYKGHSLNGDSQPAVYVSWEDAKAFAEWLKKQNGDRYSFRLPSEAQWEYATRAGTSTSRFWGNDPNDACQYANVTDDSLEKTFDWSRGHDCNDGYAVTSLVGKFRANSFGLYDTLGNAWEWCADWHDSDAYSGSIHQQRNPFVNSGGPYRVIRGGSWGHGPAQLRSAYRYYSTPDNRYYSIGFRLLRTN